MTIKLLFIGKMGNGPLDKAVAEYRERLGHYTRFSMVCIPYLKNSRNLSQKEQMVKEGALLLKQVSPVDHLVLLDEKGKHYSSLTFSRYFQGKMNGGTRNLVFVIGGAYGFSDAVRQRAQESVSLSQMTFPHQMVRLFFVEQVYRAFTILRNEPYHHQ